MGQAAQLRSGRRGWRARADDGGAPAQEPKLDDVRLRMGGAAASARLSRRDAGCRPGLDPAGASEELRRGAAEAAAVPGAEGGVLPLGLRAKRIRAARLVDRSRKGARRAAAAARRLALPPALESAVPHDARAS